MLKKTTDTAAPSPYEIYDQAARIIEKNYINSMGNSITLNTSKRPDIYSLISQLDSCSLISQKESENFQNPFVASIGIGFNVKDGSVTVTGVFLDSPANRAGIKSDDMLLEINGEQITGLSSNMILARLFGVPGSEITLKLARKNNEPKSVTLIREIVKIDSVADARIINGKIGYIRLSRFNEDTPQKLAAVLKKLFQDGMKGLVIDLRGNEGGLLSAVIETTQLFLKRGLPIVHVNSNNARLGKTHYSSGWTHYLDLPMAVLIDKNTAAGAEIMASALNENKRAVLIGEATSGNPFIYSYFTLTDGSLLGLRTYYILTAQGRQIKEIGVQPDIEVIISPEARKNLYSMLIFNNTAGRFNLSDSQHNAAISYLMKQIEGDTLTQ